MDEMKIYDWSGATIPVPISGKIVEVAVKILSGDEVVTVKYDDGTYERFDAGDLTGRGISFNDGSYTLRNPENIKRWMEFDPTQTRSFKNGTECALSYIRQEEFQKLEATV